MSMTAEQLDLWRRIEGYSIDREGSALPFSARLAQQNGWSKAFARRAIGEYKRFAFLGVAAGHPVSPSEEVDEVWHLHLTYTQDYWRRFCGEVLQKEFHHNPTQGGAVESAKFDDWYSNTLGSYHRLFGEEPPEDIWPPPEARARARHDPVKVDRATHWVIRKPKARIGTTHGVLALTLLIAAGCAEAAGGGSNPFDYTGPEFLKFYVVLYAACFVAAQVLRYVLRTPATGPDPLGADLGASEAACLTGGKRVVAYGALVGHQDRRRHFKRPAGRDPHHSLHSVGDREPRLLYAEGVAVTIR